MFIKDVFADLSVFPLRSESFHLFYQLISDAVTVILCITVALTLLSMLGQIRRKCRCKLSEHLSNGAFKQQAKDKAAKNLFQSHLNCVLVSDEWVITLQKMSFILFPREFIFRHRILRVFIQLHQLFIRAWTAFWSFTLLLSMCNKKYSNLVELWKKGVFTSIHRMYLLCLFLGKDVYWRAWKGINEQALTAIKAKPSL